MRNTAQEPQWKAKLAEAAAARDVLPSPQAYYNALKPLCRRLDIWHTIYNHPLDGTAGIVEWVKATGLRPFLNPLDSAEQQQFLASYQKKLDAHYPTSSDGKTLLRFPRLFIVAVK
jgi:trans-aconitate 2-methyltransferase